MNGVKTALRRLGQAVRPSSLLAGFTAWFASSACVWETTILVCMIAAAELSDSHLDPHGFWLLWALTLFSGITQPALAHASSVAGEQTDKILAQMQALLQRDIEREDQIAALEERIISLLTERGQPTEATQT